ncbi:MAG: response regulator [Bacteroidia bacterium]
MVTRDGDQIKILYADDDADDREFFQDALEEAHTNAKLTTVEDGDKLMKYLAEVDGQHPDIIFLDINMPRKTGKQCLKEIRNDNLLAHIPVIMFSTSAYKEDIEETFANGANLYVSKPVFFNDEVEILKKIFALHWQKELLKIDKKRFVLHTPTLR